MCFHTIFQHEKEELKRMDIGIPQTTIDPIKAELILRLEEDKKFKSRVNWFFWIAGLSLINTILFYAGSDTSFSIGLGVTLLIDVIIGEIATELGGNPQLLFIIGVSLDLVITGLFILFGVLGRKYKLWAIIVGLVLYAADAALTLYIGVYTSAIFHVVALIFIGSSLYIFKTHEKNVINYLERKKELELRDREERFYNSSD